MLAEIIKEIYTGAIFSGDQKNVQVGLFDGVQDLEFWDEQILGERPSERIIEIWSNAAVKPDENSIWDTEKNRWIESVQAVSVPAVVTMRQARLALLKAGLLDEIDAAMTSDKMDRAIKIEWEFASEVRRDWAAIGLIKQMFSMTDEQLDGLFVLAATL